MQLAITDLPAWASAGEDTPPHGLIGSRLQTFILTRKAIYITCQTYEEPNPAKASSLPPPFLTQSSLETQQQRFLPPRREQRHRQTDCIRDSVIMEAISVLRLVCNVFQMIEVSIQTGKFIRNVWRHGTPDPRRNERAELLDELSNRMRDAIAE